MAPLASEVPVSVYGNPRPPADQAPTVEFGVVRPPAGPPYQGPPTGPPHQGPPAPGTPPDISPVRSGSRSRRWMMLAAGLAIAVLAAGGAVAVFAYRGDVPLGTTVLGVDIGGMSRAEAAGALRAELDRRADTLNAPVPVQVGEQSLEINPADVGLAVDVEATVAAAVAAKPSVFDRLFGSRAVDPVVTVDAEQLLAKLRETAGKVGEDMVMPAVTFEGTTPKPTYPKPGKGLDAETSAQAVTEGWLAGGPVTVPLVDVHPVTTAEEVDRLIEELAKPAVAAPVTVTTERGNFVIPVAAIAKSLVLAADEVGKIEPRVDEKALREALAGQLAKVEVKPKDATVTLANGKPRVIASSDGQQVDLAALSQDLLAALPKPGPREISAALAAVRPKTTTEEVAKLGIKEQVSTFTTTFSGGYASPRTHNIIQIAKEVDGAIVKPGEVFSLNGHTGPRGYAEGYKDAPVIMNGKLVPGVGGGASQFTTTLFNAAYYAGLEDVEHKPHSYWYSRYPSVIEATIFYPTLDLKFRNNTPYGILIDTSWTSSSITVSIWSTKVYDSVTTVWGEKRNITAPKTVYLEPGPSCIATSGINGFTQDAWRVFRKGGKEIKREKFTWTYQPEPRFVCGSPPA